MTNTDTAQIADMIEMTTGYDALGEDADAFQIATDQPCENCGTVAATATLDPIGEGERRLCADCAF